jgi:Tat protein translocase TatB subunit
MFDFSFAELLLVIVVGVVFIGPKDLPVVIKAISKAMRILRDFSHEVKQAFEDISRESGLHETKQELEAEMRMIKGDDGKYYEAYDIKHIDGISTPPADMEKREIEKHDVEEHDRPGK